MSDTFSMRFLSFFVVTFLLSFSCSTDDTSEDDQQPTDVSRHRDLTRDVPTGGGDDSTATDSQGADSVDETGTVTSDVESETDTGQPFGPDNPDVQCTTHADCPDEGDDPGVCCTWAPGYVSACGVASTCIGGWQDACLTSEQCEARDPGWHFCCHDPLDHDFCAWGQESCHFRVECESPAECVGETGQPCCIYSTYWQRSYCGSEYFSNSTEECP